MNAFLARVVRVVAALAGLALMALTAAVAAGVLAAVLLRSAWRGLRGQTAARTVRGPVRPRAAATAGLGAREAVVDVVARGRS